MTIYNIPILKTISKGVLLKMIKISNVSNARKTNEINITKTYIPVINKNKKNSLKNGLMVAV
jgi:hypothetical protein